MRKVLTLLLFGLVAVVAYGQSPDKDAQKREKEFYDKIQELVDRQTTVLDLAPWQVFKLDSTLTHDYTALTARRDELMKNKVTNMDIYQKAADECEESIYNSYKKFLNPEQWEKYLKRGAAKEKKARDKRMAKFQN